MKSPNYKKIAVALVVICFLGAAGLASTHSLVHESPHAHHQQGTHGTVLCSWMCTAGQVLDVVAVPVLVELTPIQHVDLESFSSLPFVALKTATFRGPSLLIQA